MMMRSLTRFATAFAIAAALGLTACNSTPEPLSDPIQDNMVTDIPADNAAALNSIEPPVPDNTTVVGANTVAPPPEFSDTEQMRDDADATGLTSRLPTDDTPSAAANETQPAQ